MKKRNNLEMIEAKVCKITGGLAHKDCPDECQEKVKRRVPKNKILKEYKLKIVKDNLYIYWVVENGFKSKDGKYDIERALDKCKFISNKFSVLPDSEDHGNPYFEDPYPENSYHEKYDVFERHEAMELRKRLSRMKNYKKQGRFVTQINPKPISEIEAYPSSKEYFGSDIKFKRLKDEIEDLIAKDVDKNNKTLRRLRKKYHLYKKDENKDFDVVGTLWDWVEEDKKAIKQSREVIKLFKEQKTSERKRAKEIKKPFKFNMSQVLVARKMEIISPEESQVLKFRYNLKGQGTKSLRLIAGWLGESHTTVRNIENRALKKMKEHMEEIKKFTPIKEPMGRDITEEEYKRRFGYYPDLGKK